MSIHHLDQTTIADVTNALINLGLTADDDVAAMTVRMPPRFAALVRAGSGLSRLLTLADLMNTTPALVGGQLPLRTWLENCIVLAADRPQELILRHALERASVDGVRPGDSSQPIPPQAATTDTAAVPRHEDDRLEIAIGEEDDTLDVRFLHLGSAASRSVAKLLVHRHFDGAAAYLSGNRPDQFAGTGWLVGPRLMITNYHVVNARQPLEGASTAADFALQAGGTTVQFDYLDGAQAVLETRAVECVASNSTLDYAVLRLAPDAPDRPPLRLRRNPIVRPKERRLQERVNVLQHPDGRPMRLGFRNNFVVTGTAERLSYLTDTAGGSSGSPICDDEWFVAALHRGWTTIPDGGVLVWGRTIHQENYGTPIGRIVADLQLAHPDVYAQVMAGQPAEAGAAAARPSADPPLAA